MLVAIRSQSAVDMQHLEQRDLTTIFTTPDFICSTVGARTSMHIYIYIYIYITARLSIRQAFQPRQFCFAVRRSERHSPEGTISIEEDAVGLDESSIRSPTFGIDC